MKRSVLIVGGVVVLVLLLAGAAFLAGRLVREGSLGGKTVSGPKVVFSDGGGTSVEAQFKRAKELPDEPADVTGFYARREDNSVFVNEATGEGFRIAINEDGDISTNADDKETEVVVTNDTRIYVDVTAEIFDESFEGDTVQQKLKPGTVEEIDEYSIVMAWGDKRGDRVIANLLVYTNPPVIRR
jgi:hypothetical protein